ncbi:hypothetical protein YC2023_123977 [Brassica napus]
MDVYEFLPGRLRLNPSSGRLDVNSCQLSEAPDANWKRTMTTRSAATAKAAARRKVTRVRHSAATLVLHSYLVVRVKQLRRQRAAVTESQMIVMG